MLSTHLYTMYCHCSLCDCIRDLESGLNWLARGISFRPSSMIRCIRLSLFTLRLGVTTRKFRAEQNPSPNRIVPSSMGDSWVVSHSSHSGYQLLTAGSVSVRPERMAVQTVDHDNTGTQRLVFSETCSQTSYCLLLSRLQSSKHGARPVKKSICALPTRLQDDYLECSTSYLRRRTTRSVRTG